MKRLVITTLLIVEVVSSGRIDENIAGQTEIASCVFPFTYGGKQYTECTVTDATEPWCSTTSNYNVDKRWRFCADWMRVEYGGNTGGEPCQFPFLFAGVNISTCITSYSDIPWCSTTANYDQEKTWSFCRSIKKSDLADYEEWKSKQPKPACSPSFLYRGQNITGCDFAFSTRPWCSLTPDYNADYLWRYCTNITLETAGGNDPLSDCKFPYKFGGSIWDTCVPYHSNQTWCSTTSDYDADRKWTYCLASAQSPKPTEGNCSAGTSLAWEGPMQVGRRNDYTSYTGVESKTTQNGLLECTDRCLKVPQCVSFDAYPFVNISNPSLTTHTCYYYTALRTAAELAAPTSPQDEVTYYQWRCV